MVWAVTGHADHLLCCRVEASSERAWCERGFRLLALGIGGMRFDGWRR